jgi:Domain of unknown function (DUF1707)
MPPHYSRAVAEPHELRVSDADRDRLAREIREHYAAGRLTSDELDERIDAVYKARTESELLALRTDLPQLPVSPAERRAELVARRSELRQRLIQRTGASMVPFVVCTAIWAASGASAPFWPIWVALFALIPLLRNGWRLYGPAPQLDRVERELERRRRHRRHHHRHHYDHRL